MVPLRSDYGEGKTSTWEGTRRRPLLVLCDVATEPAPRPVRTACKKLSTLRRWESLFLSAAVIAVVLFFTVSFGSSLWHSAAASYQSSLLPSAPVISRRVVQGDTLWQYASHYGDPNTYILDRVETIARDNHLPPDAALVPGQVVHISVHNPLLVARLAHRHSSRIAGLPR